MPVRTRFPELQWGITREEMENLHIFLMTDDRPNYVDKLVQKILKSPPKHAVP